jgi:hypothetical protein
MPFDDEPTDSLPLNWTAGASIGWDSNASPQFSKVPGVDTDDVLYVVAFVQANFVSKTPQTTWDVWARVGATYYLDNIDQNGGAFLPSTRVETDFFPQIRGGINFVHRVNECLRLRSISHASWEQEPDYDYGIATDRRNGSYLRLSSDNSAGYRWTERFATNTGYRLSLVDFEVVDRQDYVSHLFYNQFRYRSSESTVLTAAYRIQFQNNDVATDSTSHYFLVGAEHELSPVTVVVLRVGGQYFDPDRRNSSWSPYAEATIRTAVSETVSLRAFIRYGIEDRNRRIATHSINPPAPVVQMLGIYDERKVLRIGTQGSYVVSSKFTIFAGGHIILTDYDGKTAGSHPGSPGSFNESIYNLNVGASVEVRENVYVTGSYNFTLSESDSNIRDYERHRAQLGVQAAF